MSRTPKLVAALFVVLLLGGFSPAYAAPQPPEQARLAKAAFRALQQRSGLALQTRWDDQYGTLAFVAALGNERMPVTGQASETPEAVARAFLEQNKAMFGLTDVAQELTLLRNEPDTQLGWSHLRFDQYYHGIPVYGKQLVVHLDAQLQPVAVNGHVVPGLNVPTEASISSAEANQIALRDLRGVQLDLSERLGVKAQVLPEKTTLVVYVDQQGKANLAWSVRILTEQPLGEWQYFVHARRPFVLHAFDELNGAKRRVTYTAGNSTRLPGRKLIDEGERSNDRVAQAAHDNAGIVYDYYFSKFKRDSIDGKGMTIVSTVHYGSSSEDSENAAWVGELQQMIYGDGGQIFQPLALGLDVVAHELTHGVTDSTAQLIYEGQSGALNEAYSDIMATMIDTKNWTLGEDVVQSPPFPVPVLRDMQDPTLGGVYDPNNPLQGIGQPATADEYANLPVSRSYDNGGVHINSGIPNHGAYLIATAIGRDKAEQIYYRTLTQYMTPDSDFFDHANATVRATQDLYGQTELNAVRQAFAQIGIDASGAETLPPPPSDGGGIPNIPSQPDQDEPLPAGCSDLVINGGFESDDAWVEVSAGEFAIIDPELPHSGKRSAWLGGTDQEPLQIVYQDIRIPPNASSVSLQYWRLVHEEFTGLSGILSSDATFSTIIANTNGDVVGTVEQHSSSEGDDTWSQGEFDLSEFAGKTIRLAFTAENSRGNVSSYFVDDVVLAVCTAGSSPSSPKPSTAGQVYIEGTITNASTGQGISGAQVFFLKPGVSATQAARDDVVSDSEVQTYGTTDNSGYYRTSDSLPTGQTYSVIILAGGYRPIIADNAAEVPSDASNPAQIDASMRRGR